LVVISWWSNCLGLACLHRLLEHTRHRAVYVVQAGKTEEQKERFRAYLPAPVQELHCPGQDFEDWRVRESVARELLPDREGLWFVDHDLFLQVDAEAWLEDMDRRFAGSDVCLCHPTPRRGPSITNPAFWLSPVRFPPGMPSYARLPYHEDPAASRPYAPRQGRPPALMMPEKDTLVAAMEVLQQRNMVSGFPLVEEDRVPGGPAPFPGHEHIGGLYTFANRAPTLEDVAAMPAALLRDWAARCVERFAAFYAACPPAWVTIEDPVLMRRLDEFRQAISA
jgi:hypothetical protein